MKKYYLLFFIIVLSACAPNPLDVADAYATTSQADSQSLADAQARAIKQGQADYAAQRREAAAAEMDAAIRTTVRLGTFALALVLIVMSISISVMIKDIGRGAGQAIATAMDLKARLIQLDPVTRQYPLLLQHIGKGQFTLTNPNINSVMLLDCRNEPDRLMILAMARTQATGSLARESRLSLKPEEVSRIDLSALEVSS